MAKNKKKDKKSDSFHLPGKMHIGGRTHGYEGSVESAGGDTLMGRLAERMASRDMIDELDLGPKGRAPSAKQATVADSSEVDFPTKMHMSSQAVPKKDLKTGKKIEKEHDATVNKINPNFPKEKARELIRDDHLKEHSKYYDATKGLPAMEKTLANDKRNDVIRQPEGKQIYGQEPNTKVRKGNNMAEQARNAGNVFETRYKK